MSTISTLSLSHTHTAYVTIHIHTQDWSYTFKNPYTPSVLRTQAHTGPTASPPFPGTQAATATFTHTHSPIIPPINHTVTSGNHHASYRYILSVCHSRHLCHTDCGHPTPQPKHSLLPMLWGLQPGCQSKIPHLQFHVFSDKKIS